MHAEFYYHREKKNILQSGASAKINVPLHFHAPIELYLVTEGEVEIWINDRRRVLKAGELSVALQYDAHSYRRLGEAKAFFLMVSPELCGDFVEALGNRRPRDPFISDPQAFEQMLGYCKAIAESDNLLQKKGNLYLALGVLQEVLSLEERPEKQDPDLSGRILLYIHEHFKEDCAPTRIAAELGYHPAYLSRFFRQQFHVSIGQYVTLLRLREAVMLMKDPQNSIMDCAYEGGFSSIRTFYRAFAAEFGCSPKEYRK